MERRVVKLNLVGTICTLILIILIIVGIIVFAIKMSNKDKNQDGSSQQNSEEVQTEENEIKETVIINGQKQEITMKKFISDFSYKMNYDSSKFYIDKSIKDKDVFKSLESDTVLIEVEKFNEGFKDKSQEIITSEVNKKRENSTYTLDAKNLNNRLCYVEQVTKEDNLFITYTIENKESYYIINVKIGKEFIETNKPIIEKMIESFRVM